MHAAVITAYKDFEMLEMLASKLERMGMLVLIHIDRKSSVEPEVLGRLRQIALVKQRYSVSWGSRNHLLAILDLIRDALRDPRVTYIHTLSGQDFPIVPMQTIQKICNDRIFMKFQPIEATSDVIFWRFSAPRMLEGSLMPNRFVELTNRLVEKCFRQSWARSKFETKTFSQVYFGLVWLSMPRDASEYVCYGESSHALLRDLRRVWVSEEFYFQTLLVNSHFRQRISNNNVRFHLGEFKHGTAPGILDEDDYISVVESGAIFARKFDSRISGKLLSDLTINGDE